jgi:hypothetical protein
VRSRVLRGRSAAPGTGARARLRSPNDRPAPPEAGTRGAPRSAKPAAIASTHNDRPIEDDPRSQLTPSSLAVQRPNHEAPSRRPESAVPASGSRRPSVPLRRRIFLTRLHNPAHQTVLLSICPPCLESGLRTAPGLEGVKNAGARAEYQSRATPGYPGEALGQPVGRPRARILYSLPPPHWS